MSEYLAFNKSGQWELRKATNDHSAEDVEPKSDYKTDSKKYGVYRGAALDGDLHEDRGQKGTLHDTGYGKRPKQINWKNVGRAHKDNESVFTERNPGVGD